jgi:Ni/Co efflux regulator RcnB
MKSRFIAPLLIVSLLAPSVAVFAQQHDNNHDNNHGGAHPSHDNRPNPGHDVQHGHGPAPRNASLGGPGGPVPHNEWHKGERLPTEYRDRNYVVDNWHEHNLQAPPRGYQWVGVNGDYVLAAVATGVIASVLLSAGH